MKKNHSSILIINEAIKMDDQNSDDDDYLDIIQKNKGKKVKKFEKYKPKPSNSKEDEKKLEGAENKVKSLLSLFLHNIETEEKKDLESDRFFLNEIKTVKRIQKQNKFETSKKINIYCDRRNSNILHKKEEFNKIGTICNVNLNYIRNHSQQFTINEKNNPIKKKRTDRKNQDKSNFYKNKRKSNLIKDNDETANLKSSLDISSNQNNNNNFIKETKTDYPEIVDKNNIKKIKSVGLSHTPNKKNNKNNHIQKYCMMKTESEFTESKLKKKMKNSLKTPNKIKNIATKNETKRDSILSSDSKSILKNLTEFKIEIKTEDQIKDSSFGYKNLEESDMASSYVNKNKTNSILRTSNISGNKKNDNSSISKKSSINASTNSNKNSLIGSLAKRKRHILSNKGFHGIMRAITSSIGINKDLIKKDTNKIIRAETALKNLQEKIKQTIILRPEDLVLDFTNEIKPLVKKEKTTGYKEEAKNCKLSSQSILSLSNKKNELDISKKNSNEIKKPENIPTVIQNINKNTEQICQMVSKDLLKNDTLEELQEDINQKKFIKLHEKYRIFIHRNQVYDSLDDEEIEDETSNYIYFNPDSIFILIFDAILLFFTLFSLYWIPFYLAHNLNFCKESKIKFRNLLNLFIEFINLLDLFFGFFKAYYNFEEQLINQNSIIAKKYLTDWFIIDLISAIPFYSIFKFQEKKCNNLDLSTNYYNNVLYNLNYLYMCNRVLKMIKVFFSNKAYKYLLNNYQEKRTFLKLIINLIRISCLLFIFHFCACLYIFIGRNSYPNWIIYTKLEIKSFADIYLCAIYMLITTLTTVGYGDITCYSFHERLFQLFLLIIGIMSYSFAVSSFSNYIQKINEKSIEFEKRKDILDDIKLNNPNLPDKLYDRILRYLKYKNLSEKRDKHIILDCLPVGLKNNLVYEMYKPIIKNFIFFKNFENTDFIVRVILCFRPIIAIKNDILVNEGEIIEDIMFVKKGILSVELPINIKNPQENVEKYLNMTILKIEKGPDIEKVGKSTIINSNMNISMSNTNSLGKTVLLGEDIEKKINKSKSDNKKISDETTYVKILNIRENEHFGDVLMFLEKRSPLRVRVRSRKAELFFLKKTDAVKISSIYQNIWNRINKKSVFNFEQIKKSIHKIIEIYCSFKTMKTLNENKENIKKRKTFKRTIQMSKHKLKLYPITYRRIKSKSDKKILNKKNKYFDNSIKGVKSSRNITPKKHSSKTFNLNSSSLSSESDSDYNEENDESEIEEYSNQNNNSNRKKKRPSLRHKFYKGPNKYNNTIDSIIVEEPGKESTITPIKKNETNIFNKSSSNYNKNATSSNIHNFKRTVSTKQRFEKSASLKEYNEGNSKSNLDNCYRIKCINEKEEIEEDENSNNNKDEKKRKKTKEKEIKNYEKSKFNKKKIYSDSDSDKNYNIDESKIHSLPSNKNESLNIIRNINDMDKKDLVIFEKKDINDEIYPNEIFNIPKKEENLFSRKIKLSQILNQSQNNLDNLIQKNNKIQFLLDSDKGESIKNNQNDINKIKKTNNIENINKNYNKNKKTNENNTNSKNHIPCKNNSSSINYCFSKIKTMIPYSIIKITEIEYKSLYENLNKITDYKYSSNIKLQNKVKNIITESSLFISPVTSNSNSLAKKYTVSSFNKSPILNFNKPKFVTTINPSEKFNNICSLSHINSINNQKLSEINKNINKKHKSKKRNSPLTKRSETFSNVSEPKKIRSTSIDNYKSKQNKFQTGIGSPLNNKKISFAENFGIKAQKTLKNKYEFEKQKINNNKNIIVKKIKGEKNESFDLPCFLGRDIEKKKSMRISPNFFSRKKRGSLLSQINLNIEKTNQNLNNPEEFYTNYFNSILGVNDEQSKIDTKKCRCKRRSSAICFSNKMIMSPRKNLKNKNKK